MRAGAFDFVVKPAAPERLQAAVANAMKVEDRKAQANKGDAGNRPSANVQTFGDLITASPAMERVVDLLSELADDGSGSVQT